jgi:signal transduction histidine kinase
MKRTWALWAAFSLCVGVVLAAMGWLSVALLRLDEAEARAREQAVLEECVGLALWRMDSALSPILAQESARPYFTYRTFLPVDRGYGRMLNRGFDGEALIPSPLLGEVSPYVLVHFQFEPDGRLTCPRVPEKGSPPASLPPSLSKEAIEKAKGHLARVGALADRPRLMALLPPSAPGRVEVVFAPLAQNTLDMTQNSLPQSQSQPDAQNRWRGALEFGQRAQAVANMRTQAGAWNAFGPLAELWAPTDLTGVPMKPLWLDGELVLARRVAFGGREYVQGCLLDWPAIRRWLVGSIEDLLPGAELEPIAGAASEGEGRMLAALPVRLVPGLASVSDAGPASPLRLTLAVAWGSVLLAAAAVAGVVGGVLRLSQRRAAFVSAVTHELRTPLTTLHMYTEMLGEGMVSDPARRQEYLITLRAEASRLTHLVENVLAYARLERGRAGGRVEPIVLDRLIEPIRTHLADRAAAAGMELVVEADDSVRAATVRANPSAVEQILLNLVDNACKYAAAAVDKRIHLIATRDGDGVRLGVRDHGPGIPQPAARRLFRPFHKSAREAANSAPGVGLGLALSKRLAQNMGARLGLDRAVADGACFVLSLPAVSPC